MECAPHVRLPYASGAPSFCLFPLSKEVEVDQSEAQRGLSRNHPLLAKEFIHALLHDSFLGCQALRHKAFDAAAASASCPLMQSCSRLPVCPTQSAWLYHIRVYGKDLCTFPRLSLRTNLIQARPVLHLSPSDLECSLLLFKAFVRVIFKTHFRCQL